jgi:hypothetical protein
MDVLYRQVNSISNVVCKSYMTSYYLALFFISYFPTTIPSVYTERIFMSVFTNGYKDRKIIGKDHWNISTEKLCWCFRLYLLIFW